MCSPAPIFASAISVAVVLACFAPHVSMAQDSTVISRPTASAWEAAARKYGVDVSLLYAMALRESGLRRSDGAVRAWPWTLRSAETGAIYFETYEAAVEKLTSLIAQGKKNIDVGLMQVNWGWNGHRQPDPRKLLLPSENIEVAAQILREHLDTLGGDLRNAVARYHNPRAELGIPYAVSVLAIRDFLQKDQASQEALRN